MFSNCCLAKGWKYSKFFFLGGGGACAFCAFGEHDLFGETGSGYLIGKLTYNQ